MESLHRTATTFTCDPPCSRKFKSQGALIQHKNNAPRHIQGAQLTNGESMTGTVVNQVNDAPSTINNDTVGVTSELHGAQGVRVSTPKSKGKGARSSPGTTAVGNGVRKASPGSSTSPTDIQQTKIEPAATPLDRFFACYPEFQYDRDQPPAKSFRLLEHFSGWERNSTEQAEAWKSYQQALIDEVRLWFGNEDDLASWHQLCRAVGIRKLPPKRRECKRALQRTHINIVDLIDWGRSGQPAGSPVKVYRTVAELSEYTFSTNKIFPANQVMGKDGETNIVLRHLLRRLFKAAAQVD
ncbi:hypothetical protein SEPCBS57363_002321 [Sporothrix epigloea]|uniref:C2H2-type domain-containing protein n=1 Tax=Sporothrix epigloea TaxID=1892477 RepID=A0ABP0DHY1_9PEZI